ncbi:MAG: immunoglobulin domain-containing protein, partial [Planctomycetota bacterium]
GSGIEYQEFYLDDPNNVFVARMDRGNINCIIESSIGQGRLSGGTERVSSQANRYDDALNYWMQDWGRRNDVVVAINGDFYNTATGVPTSGQIHSGWFAKNFSSGSFVWTLNRNAFISWSTSLTQYVTYTDSGIKQQCQGVNRQRGSNELIIYTPQFDSDTNTDNSGVEVLVEMTRPTLVLPSSDGAIGYVRQIRVNQGSTSIPFDHVVLSATGSAATTLSDNVSIGSEVSISPGSGGGSFYKAYSSVGGGEIFLSGGAVLGGQNTRHPRTAIALNDDYIFFVVVDGRDPGVSIGMNMIELGYFCKDYLGAAFGINQDGGGSSTMVVNGVVKNNPSDGNERYVSNGMMMVVLQPKNQSTTYEVSDQVQTTARSDVRLGPGTNYAVLNAVVKNTQGAILNHHLRGIYAKGDYWWKCDFASTVGWVEESELSLVSNGNFPHVTLHPADQEVCTDASAIFNVQATGQGTLTYQWQINGMNLSDGGNYSGVTTSTLTISNVGSSDMASYRCVVTDVNGSTTSYSAALLPPLTLPAITEHPQSQEIPRAPVGSNVTFTISATGNGTINYQWQKDGNDLSNDGHYSGVTTSTLTISNVHSVDDGNYRCRVSTVCDTLYSNEAILKVATADFDEDNDVDLEDFGHLQQCINGPAVHPTDSNCLDANLDADSDVDQDDFAIFLPCLTGTNIPLNPFCAD